jgi:hypothetical protein
MTIKAGVTVGVALALTVMLAIGLSMVDCQLAEAWGRGEPAAWGFDNDCAWGIGSDEGVEEVAEEEWAPWDITNVAYFWRADSGITYGATAPACTSWTDIVAGKVAYAAAAAKEPAWYTGVDGINGQPVVKGDGSNDFLTTTAFASALSQPYTVWSVATVATDNNAARCCIYGITAGTGLPVHRWVVGVDAYQVLNLVGAVSSINSAGIVVFQLVITEYTTGVDNFWVNDTLKVTGNDTDQLTGLTLFTDHIGTFPSNSKIAEVGIVSGVISAADQALLEAYIQTRYGIAAW